MRTAKTLIRLGGCPHSFCWFCHIAAHIKVLNRAEKKKTNNMRTRGKIRLSKNHKATQNKNNTGTTEVKCKLIKCKLEEVTLLSIISHSCLQNMTMILIKAKIIKIRRNNYFIFSVFQYKRTSSLLVMTHSSSTSVASVRRCLAVTALYRYIYDHIQVIISPWISIFHIEWLPVFSGYSGFQHIVDWSLSWLSESSALMPIWRYTEWISMHIGMHVA